jgi:hypothetical protein
MLGLPRCFTFGGLRVDAAVARELLRAVEPMAIEAAVEAERRYMEARGEQQRIVELELQQARYEASLAERRYAACDPDNRLIAAQQWLREQLPKLSRGNDLAKAMDYMLKRWPAFTRFLDDGRICLSNNAAERALRGIAMRLSLCPSCSSVWKHWKLCSRSATRGALSSCRTARRCSALWPLIERS